MCEPMCKGRRRKIVYPKLGISALLVHNDINLDTAAGRAAHKLIHQLEDRQVNVTTAESADDAVAIIKSSPETQCLILQWGLENDPDHTAARHVLDVLRDINDKMPVFLLAERGSVERIPVDVMQKSDDFIWALEDGVYYRDALKLLGEILDKMEALL